MRISKGVVKAVSRLERRGSGRGSQVRKRLAGGGSRFEPSVPLANGSPFAPKGNVVAVKRGSLVSVVSLTGDRGFESCSLHQRVRCEPDSLDQSAECWMSIISNASTLENLSG